MTDLFTRVESLKARVESRRTASATAHTDSRARFFAAHPDVARWLDDLAQAFPGAERKGFVDGYWERRGGWPLAGEGGPPPPAPLERGRYR